MTTASVENPVSWADDLGDMSPVAPHVVVLPDGTQVVVEYKINDNGKKVKVTRKIRKVLVKQRANQCIAERKRLRKFGEDAGKSAGPDPSTTTLSDRIPLKLSHGISELQPEPDLNAVKKAALAKANVKCRICKGEHFTAKCPFKESAEVIKSMEMALSGKDSESASMSSAPPPEMMEGGKTSGKYVPPAFRGGARGPGEAPPGTNKDEYPTIRVRNLTEDASEDDLRDLFGRYGTIQRVHRPHDRITGESRPFAFLSFFKKESAEEALEKMDGHGYDNLILRCEWAKSSSPNAPSLG